MTSWLGVVSADHVARGVRLGIVQTNHGERAGLARMHQGDTLVYYSPVQRMGDKTPLQAFTAIGEIADEEIWQADEGDFKPFRRAVRYRAARPVPLAAIRAELDLTKAPNWGYQLRRGLIQLTEHDAAALAAAMAQP
jgi:hypothetical protein